MLYITQENINANLATDVVDAEAPAASGCTTRRLFLTRLGLKTGGSFLDIGCGLGDYAIYAARIVGDSGAVYAVDKWKEMIIALLTEADYQGLENIFGIVSDITASLPLKDHCVDVCFISTVIHMLDINKVMKPLLGEIRRVLKPTGRLAIIECKKQDQPFGPPKYMRLSPEEIEASITPFGLEKTGFVDLGYNYLIQFKISRAQKPFKKSPK